jgi:uncharacterized 2Fe-2S/4Fe-4S cluster protein (DUF4445 family)
MTPGLSIDGARGAAAPGRSLFEAAEAIGRRPPSSCEKNGRCRECLLDVVEGADLLAGRTEAERHLDGAYRLACQARVLPGSGTIVARQPGRGVLRITSGGQNLPASAFDYPFGPAVRRAGGRVFIDGAPVPADDGPILGAAMDLGTTTIVLRVHDLETGAIVAGASFENPQRFAGSDVMARISFDTRHGGRLLQRVLLNSLSAAFAALPVDSKRIFELLVAGNTTMRDLFFGLDVEPIGQKPYRSVTETAVRERRAATTAISVPAKRLRLPLHPSARVAGLPLLGSHVGADAAACLLALDMDRRADLAAFLDIGTNTEVACGNRDVLYAASCPAGPAFEGAGVRCGMPGWDGAVERVRLDGEGRASVGVIGGGEPLGLCGSGIVDTLGELRRLGLMDEYGRFNDGRESFDLVPGGRVRIDEADIGQLAQAKGANAAGLRILLERQGVRLADIARLHVAGGFGRHLDLAAARSIGLVPDMPADRVVSVGNAAMEGVSIALLSTERRDALERYVRSATHVELETDPEFFDIFVEGCLFKPFGAS